MGYTWALECDGCKARSPSAERDRYPGIPEGWRIFTVKPFPDRGRDDDGPAVVCGQCWGTKTLAEVLRC